MNIHKFDELSTPKYEDLYDEDYFKNGSLTGKSCYDNYRWIPELTYPLAYAVCNHLKLSFGDRVLEYGCAHGYLVRALRDFGINAFGVDISRYAIASAPKEVESYVHQLDEGLALYAKKRNWQRFKWVIAKDVFEHIQKDELQETIRACSGIASNIFVVVPLGDEGIYRISSYANDITHVIAESEFWWRELLEANGFSVKHFFFELRGIKDRWKLVNQKGNGFFIGEAR
jgi:predicted TPR repeat methyltransferase